MTRTPELTIKRWRTGQILGTIAIAATLTAGCGAAVTSGHVAVRSRPSVQPDASKQPPWPPGGSPKLARSFGWRMLARLVLPPGAKRIGERTGPPRAEVIGSQNLVDLHRFFSITMPAVDAASFVNRHTPAGFLPNGPGLGTTTAQDGAIDQFVSFNLRVPPVGVTADTMLLITFAAGPRGSTVARADAEVVWYPPRTAAEYLRPSAIESARIHATLSNPGPRHLVKVITSRRGIAGLAALLNGMRASDNADMWCPTFDASYHVTFIGRGGQPRVAVDPTACTTDDILANGRAQPPLWDPASRLIKALRELLGLSK